MKKWIWVLAFGPSLSFACPDLTGTFTFPGSDTISINQNKDSDGVTTYKITIDDGTCALCYNRQLLKADGIQKQISYGRAEETVQVSCSEDRLKYRRTTIYFDDLGQTEFKEVVHQDYRINDANDLAIEDVENETPVSKIVCSRLD